jgi:hypothetical protein
MNSQRRLSMASAISGYICSTAIDSDTVQGNSKRSNTSINRQTPTRLP